MTPSATADLARVPDARSPLSPASLHDIPDALPMHSHAWDLTVTPT